MNLSPFAQWQVSHGRPFTHNSIFEKGKGGYRHYVPLEDSVDFYRILCNTVESNTWYCLMEQPAPQMPVVADLDLFYTHSGNTRLQYDSSFISGVVRAYQQAISAVLEITSPRMLTCFSFEKSQTTMHKSGNLKSGIHLMFPFCIVDTTIQKGSLFTELIKQLKLARLLEQAGNPINDWDGPKGIVDKQALGNNWILHMSRKSKETLPYDNYKLYDSNALEIPLQGLFDYRELNRELLLTLGETFFERKEDSYYLPLFLSVHAWYQMTLPNPYYAKPLNGNYCLPVVAFRPPRLKPLVPEYSFSHIQELVNKLNPELANNLFEWNDICKLLRTLTARNDVTTVEGLNIFIEFSSKRDDYDLALTQKAWCKVGTGINPFLKLEALEAKIV